MIPELSRVAGLAMSRPRKAVEQTTSTLYRGSDGLWHARITMGRRPDGSADRRHVQRRTLAEARDAVRDLERRRDAGTYVRPSTTSPSGTGSTTGSRSCCR